MLYQIASLQGIVSESTLTVQCDCATEAIIKLRGSLLHAIHILLKLLNLKLAHIKLKTITTFSLNVIVLKSVMVIQS